MDLRDLERWTRDALVAEAARRAITSPRLLTRRELVEAIAADAETRGEKVTRSAISRARRFLERLAFGESPSPDVTPTVDVAAPTPPTAAVVATEPPAEPPPPPSSAPPPPGEEPIPTRTMARLLAAQGHIARARTIYDALLGAVPEDPSLRREVETLASAREEPSLRAVIAVAPPVRRAVDQVTALVVDPSTLFVCWEVSDAGMRRARAVAGDGAPLSLRVMVAASDGSGRVTTRELTRDALPEAGETFVTNLPSGALCTAAVGVVGTRFVAIAHAASAETPPAAPSPTLSLTARVHPGVGATGAGSAAAPLVGPDLRRRVAEAARAEVLEAAEAAAAAGGSAAPSSPGDDRWPSASPGRGRPSSPGAHGSRP